MADDNGQVDTAVLTGLMNQAGGFGINDARLMVENAYMGPEQRLGQQFAGSLNAVNQAQQEAAVGPAGFVRGA